MFAPNLETPEGFRVVFVGALRVRFPANMRPDEQVQNVSGIRFQGSVGETEGFRMLARPDQDRGTVPVDGRSAAPAPSRETGSRVDVPKGFGEAFKPCVRLADQETTPDSEAPPRPTTPPKDGPGKR